MKGNPVPEEHQQPNKRQNRIQLHELPPPSRQIPDDVQATIARRETDARRTEGGVPRWRVTNLSRNPPSAPDEPR